IEAGANSLEVEDLYTEMQLMRVADDPSQLEEYLGAWDASGVTCVLQNAGEEGSSPVRLLKRLAHFTYLTDRLRDHVSRAATPDDIERGKKQGQHLPLSHWQRRSIGAGMEFGDGGTGAHPAVLSTRHWDDGRHLQWAQRSGRRLCGTR